MDQPFTQTDFDKLKSKVNTVIQFAGRSTAEKSANLEKILARAKDDLDVIAKLPANFSQFTSSQVATCQGLLGYYSEIIKNLAGVNTIDLAKLDRDYRTQKASLLEDLGAKVKLIIQKGNVQLLKANLAQFNPAEVPCIFTYCVSLNSELVATEMVKLLLNDKRADPGADGNKAIIAAVEKGFTEVVRLLVDDPRVDPSVDNDTPLKIAHKKNFTVIKEILVTDFRVDSSSI